MAEHREINDIDRLTSLQANEQSAVIEFTRRVREALGPLVEDIILFGSRARDEGDEYSDIDILLVLNQLSWDIKCKISDIAAEENLKYNVVISTVRYNRKDWINPVIQGSPFALAVKNEGISL